MNFDYETLKILWWLFIGLLLIGFAVTDGFDLGVGALLPVIGRNDKERRLMIAAINRTWEGNQVWLITAGGAMFAAWPLVYATAFSGFYIALILTLFTLILRPVGFEYRSKIDDPRWRAACDWALFASGLVPPVIFGVAFGNLLQGVPFHFNDDMREVYTGGFLGLLNPFGLCCGLISLAMIVMHGSVWLQLRTAGEVSRRAGWVTWIAGGLFIAAFTLAGLWVAKAIPGYRIVAMPSPELPLMPLDKQVVHEAGAWLRNYHDYPWCWIAPAAAVLGAAAAMLAARLRLARAAFIASAAAVAGTVLTAAVAMYPFIMPSSTDPRSSLTVWDAVSSHATLRTMFWATIIFLPIILVYTSWVYWVLRGKVDHRDDHIY